jgi:hypothetical protein
VLVVLLLVCREFTQKGWQLLNLCTAYFPPTNKELEKTLNVHLWGIAKNKSDPNLSAWAELSRQNLARTILNGPRLIAPDESEIRIFEVGAKGKYSAKCRLLDGTPFNVAFGSPQTSVHDISQQLCLAFKLPESAFGLDRVFMAGEEEFRYESLAGGVRMMDVLIQAGRDAKELEEKRKNKMAPMEHAFLFVVRTFSSHDMQEMNGNTIHFYYMQVSGGLVSTNADAACLPLPFLR